MKQVVRLDDAYTHCVRFYKNNDILCVPTKELLGKLIPRVFGAKATFLYVRGERQVAYTNLIYRPNNDCEKIFLPTYCSMSMATDGTHKMKCPLPTIVNGEQQNCTVCFGKVNTWLTIANIQIECGYPLKVNQQSVDGMLNIVAALKTCNGIQASDFTSKTFISENVAMIHNNSTHSRQRSKSCKLILTWCARNDTCEPCLHSYKNHTDRIKKKRKREIGIGKENVIKKTCVDQLKEGNTLVDSLDGEIGMDTISTAKICSETLKDITVGKHVTNQSNSKHATDDNNEDKCENAIKLSEEDHDDMENILQLVLKANVPENFVLLLKSQLNNCQKGLEVHQRRWDPKIISTCLTLFLRSPQAYEDLKTIWISGTPIKATFTVL